MKVMEGENRMQMNETTGDIVQKGSASESDREKEKEPQQ
jgi:hypothetical protein